MMSVDPLVGSAVASAVNVMLDPLGASSGTFSHAPMNSVKAATSAARAVEERRGIMKTISILIPMHLAGQAKRPTNEQAGYAMAALLVAMTIMAIMFTVAMPVWKQAAQREKEEELVFRGKQYVHAIGLFQRKFANAYPPNIDVLVAQRFLRKKYKDPITNDDFVPIPVGQGAPGNRQATGQRGGFGGATSPGQSPTTQTQTSAGAQPSRAGGPGSSTTPPGQIAGGISGVTSKSKAQSIRLYNGRGHYNEWAFVYIQQQQAPVAGGAPGSTIPGRGGQPGQPGQLPGPFPGGDQPGQRGRGPFGPNGPGRGAGGVGPFDGGGVTPIQPPTPRGRF